MREAAMDKPLLTMEEVDAAVADRKAKAKPPRDRRKAARDKHTTGPAITEDSAEPPQDPNDLPEIVIRAGEIERIVNETEAALLAEQETMPVAKRLFRRGGMVVSIGFNTEPTHDGETVEAQIIVEAGDHALTERIASAAIFKRHNERQQKLVRVDPPHNIAVTLRQRRYNLKLPALVAVVNCPQFMANGQIMATAGYDRKTGIFYDPRGVSFPPVPAHPTSAQVKAELQTLKRLYRTFSFEAEIDRAVAISLPLTLIARTGMGTAPLHAFDAPVAGSGKSKLVSSASIIATGHDAGVIAQGHTPEEFEKRLATQLMKGKQLIAIDNCNFPLDGDLLNQALTQAQLEMRVLGESRDIVTRCATVHSATGNNLVIVGDLTRRSLKSRLDPKVERPELQQFDYDPIADAKAARGEIVVAALTILRAYHIAGRACRLPQLQSFAEWSDMVRSALVWARSRTRSRRRKRCGRTTRS
jgi:putative DNA primase/helicase